MPTWGEVVFWMLAFAGNACLWVEVINRVHAVAWRRAWIDGITFASCAAVFVVPGLILLLLLFSPASLSPWLTAIGYALGAILIAFLASRLGSPWDPQRDRRTKPGETQMVDLGLLLQERVAPESIRRYGFLPGNPLFQLHGEQLVVPLDHLPPALEGLRIAHLTDLHMSTRLSLDYFQGVIDLVCSWAPDFVCVTGDIVEFPEQLEWIEPVFGRLRPAGASFFVLGNHDTHVSSEELRRRLGEVGMIDVAGRAIETTWQGEPFVVYGDERPWFPSEPPPAANEAFTLGLVHTPDRFPEAVRNNADLVLAGHCHGGQVRFPLIGALFCPSLYGVRYSCGTFRKDRTVMHVGRGSGSLFPLRYGCPPEVTLLTLTAS